VASVPAPEYVVLGTIDRQLYRRGLSGGASLDDVKKHMADFKSHWKVDGTPAGWYPKGGQAGSNPLAADGGGCDPGPPRLKRRR
jgi:hypothetical protein